MITLKPGDVLRNGGRLYIVDYINDSRARAIPLQRNHRVIHDKLNGKVKEFDELGSSINITTQVDADYILERRGHDGLKQFLAGEKAAHRQSINQAAGESSNTMAKGKSKKQATEATGQPGARAKGALGEIFGHSTTSILRRLGMADVSVARARLIMEALKVKVNPATVQIQVGKGRNGQGTPADITKEQLNELLSKAAEPVKEEKAETAPKAKGKKGGKKTKAAPATAAAETPAAVAA